MGLSSRGIREIPYDNRKPTGVKASWSKSMRRAAAEDAAFLQWFGRLERAVASPSAILALMRANYEIDVGDLLPSIRVPTLIFHRMGDALVPSKPDGTWLAIFPEPNTSSCQATTMCSKLWIRSAGLPSRSDRGIHDRPASSAAAGRDRWPMQPNRRLECVGAAAEAESDLRRRDRGTGKMPRDSRFRRGGELSRAWSRGLKRVVAAARGSWSDSESQFIKAAETFRRHDMAWQEARTFQSWGHALLAGADRRAAIEKLDKAIEIYRGHGADKSWIDSVEGDLARANGSNGASRA